MSHPDACKGRYDQKAGCWQPETKGDDILPEELFDRKVKQLIDATAFRGTATFNVEQRRLGYPIDHLYPHPGTAAGINSIASFALLDRKLDGLAALVDPAQQAQNAAEAATRIADLEVNSVARIADIESKVASAAEIGAAAQPVLAALERVEASLAAQNTRLAALEARPQGGCCVIS